MSKYIEVSTSLGRPISRGAAGKRMRQRCTYELANDLKSTDPIKLQVAKFHIDDIANWPGSILSASERAKVRDILIHQFNQAPATATKILVRGFRELSIDSKMQFTDPKKDIKTLTAFAALLKDAYWRQATRAHVEKLEHYLLDEEESRATSTSKEPLSEVQNYWLSLSDEKQEYLVQKYMNLTGMDKIEAWCTLYYRCTERIASGLNSEDAESNLYAIAMLKKQFKRKEDFLTPEEKELVRRQLVKLYNAKKANQARVFNIGAKGMDEKSKQNISEDVRMNNERFAEIAKLLWSHTLAFDHARWGGSC